MPAKSTRKRRAGQGLCPGCGTKPPFRQKYCDACRRSGDEQRLRLREQRRAAGLCECGKPARAKRLTCEACSAKSREVNRRRRESWVRAGLCPDCGKGPAPLGRYCYRCARRHCCPDTTTKKRSRCGLCPSCGNKPEGGMRLCRLCREKARVRSNERAAKRRASGLCGCGRPPKPGRVLCAECLARAAEKKEERTRRGVCQTCKNKSPLGDLFCGPCVESRRRQSSEARRERRRKVLAHYGTKCACCGEVTPEFLCIDHMDGGGNKHRKRIGTSGGSSFYAWLIRNKLPEGYQTLCFNCNSAKAFFGECPHERRRRETRGPAN